MQLRTFRVRCSTPATRRRTRRYDELAAKNADFKKIYEPWQKFRDDSNLWFRVAEYSLDNYRYGVK